MVQMNITGIKTLSRFPSKMQTVKRLNGEQPFLRRVKGGRPTWSLIIKPSYMSPWPVYVEADRKFTLRHMVGYLPPSGTAASLRDDSNYLDKFCTDRSITDQSEAALAAVLLLPSMCGSRGLTLPNPRVAEPKHSCAPGNTIPRTRPSLRDGDTYHGSSIDRLLTVSCNIKGIRPMLLSAF
jgi:hypothetical protein